MTPEEARKVEAIVLTADGGCGYCVDNLTDRLQRAFPEHDWATLRHTTERDDEESEE